MSDGMRRPGGGTNDTGKTQTDLLEAISSAFTGRGSEYGADPSRRPRGGGGKPDPWLNGFYNALDRMTFLGNDREYRPGSWRWAGQEADLASMLGAPAGVEGGEWLADQIGGELTLDDMLLLIEKGREIEQMSLSDRLNYRQNGDDPFSRWK